MKKNLAAFALTDHDTTDGLEEAFSAALGSNLEIIPGIELSTTWNSTDVHIVGLDIDWKNTHFQKTLSEFQISRNLRNEKMIALLQKEGIPITTKLMEEDFPDSVWTRAHFARFLFDHKYVGCLLYTSSTSRIKSSYTLLIFSYASKDASISAIHASACCSICCFKLSVCSFSTVYTGIN